ncbi:MAG: hypothetical protein ACI4DZ_13560 [Oliverpabstia sp.]
MMGNSGKVIRQIANGLFIIQVVLTFFGAFKLARLAWDFNFGIFLVVLAVGVLLAYITNLFLSAFGELVENTQKSAQSKSGESKAVCPGCGMPINVESARFCKYCGEELRK